MRSATVLASVLLLASRAWASEDLSAGDTAWMLASTALVMLMGPGLALFYGGMVRRKNVLATLMHTFVILCVVSVVWVLWGYTLAFGPDRWGLIGSLRWLGLKGVGQGPSGYAPTVPHLVFMAFQGMFAVITPALVTGAFAERMRFSAVVLFAALWATVVYSPVAHWLWGGGWLSNLGALDFAGGTVVHINSAVAALMAALVVGRRRGFPKEPMPPHNLPMTVLGAGLLWFGWFGFNAGSALASGGLATLAFVNTNTAAASAALGWALAERLQRGKPTALGLVSGAVAGLVAITPAAGFVSPLASVPIGAVAGLLCYLAVGLKHRLGYDDSLDVLGIHGVGGLWGALATGLFARLTLNPAGADGLLMGNPSLLLRQALASGAVVLYSALATWAVLKAVGLVVGLRVSEEHEVVGLDLSQHGESGYHF
jgi:Amt family ammonium transporter